MFNDSKGRTSPGKVLGFFAGAVATVVFFGCGIIIFVVAAGESRESDRIAGDLAENMALQCVALFGLAGTLLGIRRFTKDKEVPNGTDKEL